MEGNVMATKEAIILIRGDLAPVFNMDGTVEGWEGAMMFETPANVDTDKLEFLSEAFAQPWANVTEWGIEIICTGMYKLTPREWETLPLEKVYECRACKTGDGSKCVC